MAKGQNTALPLCHFATLPSLKQPEKYINLSCSKGNIAAIGVAKESGKVAKWQKGKNTALPFCRFAAFPCCHFCLSHENMQNMNFHTGGMSTLLGWPGKVAKWQTAECCFATLPFYHFGMLPLLEKP